jgi:hypothetical protein
MHYVDFTRVVAASRNVPTSLRGDLEVELLHGSKRETRVAVADSEARVILLYGHLFQLIDRVSGFPEMHKLFVSLPTHVDVHVLSPCNDIAG